MASEGQIGLDSDDIQLPPALEQFRAKLRADRKKLLRDKTFDDPAQIRAFVGQHLFPRLDEMMALLGRLVLDNYGLAASNTNQLRRLYAFTVDELKRLGADLDEEVVLPGVSPEVMDDFQQAFYALGTHLAEKYPQDKEAENLYNNCATAVAEMVRELLGEGEEEDASEDEAAPAAAEVSEAAEVVGEATSGEEEETIDG